VIRHERITLALAPHEGRGKRQSALYYLLTRQASLPIVPAMFGLNQICGICREIIR